MELRSCSKKKMPSELSKYQPFALVAQILSLLTRWNAHPPSSHYQSITFTSSQASLQTTPAKSSSTWQLRRYVYNLEDDPGKFLVCPSLSRWPRFLNSTEKMKKHVFFWGEVVACKLVRGANTAKLTPRFGIIVEVSKYRS